MNEEFLMGTPKKELNADNYKEEEEEDDDEDESNMESMNDDHRSSLHIANYNNQGYSSSSIKNDLKKNTSGKRLKPDDEEEDVKIDTYIQRDVKSISVKDMRKLVPKLRIECFYTEQELSGKKKMKHLWDQKPPSWPVDVPFKDPNNPGKEGSTKKPGKSDLMKMYTFLREVYLKNKGLSYGSGMHSPVIQGSQQQQQQYQHVFQPESPQTYYQQQQTYSSHQQQMQQMHQQYNPQQHYGQQCHQQLSYQPNDEMMTVRKIAQPESMDDGQLIPSQIDPTLSGRTTSMSCTPSPPSNVSNGNVCQEAVKEEPFVIPSVVKDLYDRIAAKVEDVTRLQGVTDAVRSQLIQVIEEVLNPIYNGLTNTSFCLMYLDAGHQMEALLDCMIVLKKVEANLLSSGCSEIKKKFQNLDVWYVNSIIPKNIPFLESNQGCVTDCIKFRSKNHQNINIPIVQRNITFETIFELDKSDKILTMQGTDSIMDNSLNIYNKILSPLMLDSMSPIKGLLTESELNDLCQLLDDPNFVNYDLQPEPTPPSQPDPIMNGHIYPCQANSMMGLNDHLSLHSGNPMLSSSSCSPVESFTSYGGRGSVTGDSNHGYQNILFQDAGLFQYGGNSLGFMSPYNNNNNKRSGSNLISSDFISDPGVGGNHYTPIIPKSVEDMDCCDDNNSSQQIIGRQAKRRKK